MSEANSVIAVRPATVKRPAKFHNLTGQRFTRLVVISLVRLSPTYWHCVCDCGNARTVNSGNLRSGKTLSCGCLQREKISSRQKSHGHAVKGKRSRTYKSWVAMNQRCSNPQRDGFEHYGGRGISVCARWNGPGSFENFLSDMGEAPDGMTLDRKEVNWNYEPENCKWSTKLDQANNRRKRATIDKFSTNELLAELAKRELPLPPDLAALGREDAQSEIGIAQRW